jgi:hypothetical protein
LSTLGKPVLSVSRGVAPVAIVSSARRVRASSRSVLSWSGSEGLEHVAQLGHRERVELWCADVDDGSECRRECVAIYRRRRVHEAREGLAKSDGQSERGKPRARAIRPSDSNTLRQRLRWKRADDQTRREQRCERDLAVAAQGRPSGERREGAKAESWAGERIRR